MKKITVSIFLIFFVLRAIGQTLVIQPQTPSVCNGSSVTLYVQGGGSNFIWSPSIGLSATTGDTVVATPTLTVTYTVTGLDFVGNNATGYDTVTVLPLPPKPIIAVNYDTLSGGYNGADQWYLNDTAVVGARSSIYIANNNGYYYVTVTNPASGCFINSDTITLVYTEFIILPPSAIMCNGQSVVLTADPGGITYSWSPLTGLSNTTGDSVVASPTITTTYYMTELDSFGQYLIGTEIVTVMLSSHPNEPTITDNNNILTSTATQGNQWVRNDTSIIGATNETYNITDTGCYWDIVTNVANGCTFISDTICITSLTGINQLSSINNQLSVYPNPFTNEVFIKVNSAVENVKD